MFDMKLRVGDRVVVTTDNLDAMQNPPDDKGATERPQDHYLKKMMAIAKGNMQGRITQIYPEHHSLVVYFDGQAFSMRSHWITPIS